MLHDFRECAGIEACAADERKHDLKVIYTSGYSMETLGQDFSFGKGMLFLKKPYNPQALAQMVRDCLDSNA